MVGLRYEPRTGKLLMLFDNLPQQQADFFVTAASTIPGGRQPFFFTPLVQWDADTGAEDWLLPDACPSAQFQGNNDRSADWEQNGPWATPFLSRDGKAINFLCIAGADNTQFVRVELGENGEPTPGFERLPGPPLVRQILVDPQRDRTHVVVDDGYLVTFDWASKLVVGTVALSPVTPGYSVLPGIDLTTGRLYSVLPEAEGIVRGQAYRDAGGLLMIDGRRTPPPQALVFTELAAPTLRFGRRINVLPGTTSEARYVFMRPSKKESESEASAEPFYRIIEDAVPISQDSPSGELDRTLDVDEMLGKTERAFVGQASAYGWRALVVGGGVTALGGSNEAFVGSCLAANRELIAASVPRASLSAIVASAQAFPAEANQGTREDLEDVSRCWPPGSEGFVQTPEVPAALVDTGPGWGSRSGLVEGELDPVTSAECVGDQEADGKDPRLEGAEAHTSCSQTHERLEASAEYPLARVGSLTVGRAHSETTIHRDPILGVVVETVAVVEGVRIEGVGSIEAVRSRAYARANGRKPRANDTPRTTWEVSLCGVRTADFAQQGCENPDAALEALNAASRGFVLFFRPQPDSQLRQGSPGGYVAGIQRDTGDAQIVAIENNDTHAAVPGLEMHVRNDDRDGPHRNIIQLAGVQAVSSYGISLIGQGGPGGDGPGTQVIIPPVPLPPVVPLPGVGQPPNAAGPVDDIVRVVKKGLDVFLRATLDALVAAGVWSTFAAPVYLVLRRRRLRLAR